MRSRWTRVPIRRPFECMLIASLIRYDAISMDKSANQAALPRRLMATLQVRSASDDASAPLMTPLMTPLMATLQVRCASDDASAPLIMPPLPASAVPRRRFRMLRLTAQPLQALWVRNVLLGLVRLRPLLWGGRAVSVLPAALRILRSESSLRQGLGVCVLSAHCGAVPTGALMASDDL
jgi:hypothetical protein